MKNQPNLAKSSRVSLICAIATAVFMIVCRKFFCIKAETTFLGGIFGAVFFFFELIYYGNIRQKKNPSFKITWIPIIGLELVALFVSYLVHPVCVTTCLLFSIPVLVYLKWAQYELTKELKK